MGKTNRELMELKWKLRHVIRMPRETIPNLLLEYKIGGRKRRGKAKRAMVEQSGKMRKKNKYHGMEGESKGRERI